MVTLPLLLTQPVVWVPRPTSTKVTSPAVQLLPPRACTQSPDTTAWAPRLVAATATQRAIAETSFLTAGGRGAALLIYLLPKLIHSGQRTLPPTVRIDGTFKIVPHCGGEAGSGKRALPASVIKDGRRAFKE